MRLKHLQLHGYKTFAAKTEFLFPSGITAIVGPNGSGKSNIADAVRWVLGEQSYTTLRGKRTEDMIFSGSQGRAQAGMAEVVLTLDNSDGWLPVEFSQVTIGRRAFRDGQNEYRINNNKVRLRDVLELLAQSGLRRRTYTIIGQGLVDAVLSLHAQERRELFEEAAGIGHYRDRRADALDKLEQVQRNVERVHDIVSEIEPRLGRLERQAERAREHEKLSADLSSLLRTWYGFRWGQAAQTLDQARRVVVLRAGQHDERLTQIHALTEKIDRVRQAQAEARHRLGDLHLQSSALHTQAEGAQRELAVLAERAHQLAVQRDEHVSEIVTLEARHDAQAERVAQARADLAQAEQALAERQREVQAAQSALNNRLAERENLSRARGAARERHAALRAEIAERQSRWETLAEQLDSLVTQSQTNQAELTRLQETLAAQIALVAQAEAHLGELNAEQEQARQTHARLEQARQGLTDKMAREEIAVRRLREIETQVTARFELLSQLRRDLSVYGQAARSVLTASLPGLRGVLAQLIQVSADGSPDISRAVEAALGAYTAAIVVDDWQAAARALRHLRGSAVAGRVVFVSLAAGATPAPSPNSLAAHVRCDDALRPLVDRLLGRAFMVPSLDAVRDAPSDAVYVTPDGDVWRGGGIIEGGRPSEQASPLAQEQEWAALNTQRVELGVQRKDQETTLNQTRALLTKAQDRLTQSGVVQDEIRARQVAAQTAHDQATRQVERLTQEIEWRQAQLAQAQTERQAVQQRQETLTAEINHLALEQTTLEREIGALDRQLNALPTEMLNEELTAIQMALAAARQTRQGQHTILCELETTLERLGRELEARRRRVAELADEENRVTRRIATLTQDQAGVTAQLETLAAQIEPAEARLAALEREQRELEQTERVERTRIHEFESHLTAARLRVQRCEDDLAQLNIRIEEDLGLVELELGPGISGQTPLPLHPVVSKLPVVEQLPEGLEEEIKRLRSQMRRLGAVNPGAPQEYQETLERYEFLKNQSADLAQASDSLRQIIAEMDGLIEHSFKQTFEAVAAQFSATFTTLFGGGKARLELTDPDDLTHTGVEIVAQPPGKRLQALASLSGGERSLTAVALIFAILQVSPTPFCILDEVDAMLDEANVGRFRAMLEELTRHTQIVIITHNRGTISAADTIYGISMGADSVSQAYSIRLEGEKIKELEEIG